jgi:hypothetical protein
LWRLGRVTWAAGSWVVVENEVNSVGVWQDVSMVGMENEVNWVGAESRIGTENGTDWGADQPKCRFVGPSMSVGAEDSKICVIPPEGSVKMWRIPLDNLILILFSDIMILAEYIKKFYCKVDQFVNNPFFTGLVP